MADDNTTGASGAQGTTTPAATTPAGGGQAPVANTTPTPISLTDDALVTYEGAKEPVPFKNLRGLQSQFTKVSQAKSKLEADFKASQHRAVELEQAVNRMRQAAGQPAAQPNPIDKLRELPYLSGEEAAGVIGNVMSQLQQRDQAIRLLAQRHVEMENIVKRLNETHTTQSFDQKMTKFAQQLGVDPEDVEDLKIFYLAHEGEDLDEQFTELYQQYQTSRSEREKRRREKKAHEAKSKPFVPGRGGVGSASKPVDFAGMTPAEQAEIMFNAMTAADGQGT